MAEHVYFLSIGLVLGTILLVFWMRSWSSTQQAKARLDNGEAYRQLADTAVAAQSRNATLLTAIDASLADVRTRLAAVEKILKEVE